MLNKMLSKEEFLLKFLEWKKGYGGKRIMTEFPGRNWSFSSCQTIQIDSSCVCYRTFSWFYLQFNF